MRISTHFTLEELERSQTAARLGIANAVGPDQLDQLDDLCHTLLEPLREQLGPIHVTSGYRSPALNKQVGGAARSAHMDGRAADIVAPGWTPLEVCEHALRLVGVDKVIHEFGRWCHLQTAKLGKPPRRQAFTAVRVAGRTHYVPGLLSIAEAEERVRG